ncbi:MAG: hypothetical protein KC503_02270, partial [Myxococcales bacterium]|nr:hypothetical protein [Myxococcales bacterium]
EPTLAPPPPTLVPPPPTAALENPPRAPRRRRARLLLPLLAIALIAGGGLAWFLVTTSGEPPPSRTARAPSAAQPNNVGVLPSSRQIKAPPSRASQAPLSPAVAPTPPVKKPAKKVLAPRRLSQRKRIPPASHGAASHRPPPDRPPARGQPPVNPVASRLKLDISRVGRGGVKLRYVIAPGSIKAYKAKHWLARTPLSHLVHCYANARAGRAELHAKVTMTLALRGRTAKVIAMAAGGSRGTSNLKACIRNKIARWRPPDLDFDLEARWLFTPPTEAPSASAAASGAEVLVLIRNDLNEKDYRPKMWRYLRGRGKEAAMRCYRKVLARFPHVVGNVDAEFHIYNLGRKPPGCYALVRGGRSSASFSMIRSCLKVDLTRSCRGKMPRPRHHVVVRTTWMFRQPVGTGTGNGGGSTR